MVLRESKVFPPCYCSSEINSFVGFSVTFVTACKAQLPLSWAAAVHALESSPSSRGLQRRPGWWQAARPARQSWSWDWRPALGSSGHWEALLAAGLHLSPEPGPAQPPGSNRIPRAAATSSSHPGQQGAAFYARNMSRSNAAEIKSLHGRFPFFCFLQHTAQEEHFIVSNNLVLSRFVWHGNFSLPVLPFCR